MPAQTLAEQGSTYILDYGVVCVFLVLGAIFAALFMILGVVFRPKKPSTNKKETYECGEPAVADTRGRFNIRFWTVALVFVLFEVEVVLLYPVVVRFQYFHREKMTGLLTFFEILFFVLILLFGLAYVWASGDLEWIRPAGRKEENGSDELPDGSEE